MAIMSRMMMMVMTSRHSPRTYCFSVLLLASKKQMPEVSKESEKQQARSALGNAEIQKVLILLTKAHARPQMSADLEA